MKKIALETTLFQVDVLILTCDLITDMPIHRLADAHRIHDSSITMLLCPARAESENTPGMKPKKKSKNFCSNNVLDIDLCEFMLMSCFFSVWFKSLNLVF